MQANPRTLESLFNSQIRYVVPMFQRLYAWREDPQWRSLWEDVAEKADLQITGERGNAHYLGAVIIEGVRPQSPREVKRFLVIDGQQRLTTLQLLICAYRDVCRDRKWDMLDRKTSRFLENADIDVMEKPDEERYKLWPTKQNRDTFAGIVGAGSRVAVESKFPLVRLPRKRSYEPRSLMVEAYCYFHARIDAWVKASAARSAQEEENCAGHLLQALLQDFCVVEIALSEGDDSQEIFYSLNSQGRPLSQSDLLRSLIFMRAEREKEDRDRLFDEHWGRYEAKFWSDEVQRAGRTYSRLDLGLRYFLMAKTGRMIDARRVNEEYRRWVAGPPAPYGTVREELADLGRYATIYEKFEGVIGTGLTCSDLRRVLRDLDVSVAVPLLMFLEVGAGLNEEQLAKCSLVVESFLVRRAVLGQESDNREYNHYFVEIIRALSGVAADRIHDALVEKLRSGGGATRQWPTDDQVVEAAISARMYGVLRNSTLRLILERLELAHRTNKAEEQFIAADLQIEHVLPQNWATYWPLAGQTVPPNVAMLPQLATGDLSDLADKIRSRNDRIQTLGNLTLLNRHLNPAASNASFEDKCIEYRNSVLRLNRYFDERTTWDEEAIAERGRALGHLICKIWPRP